MPGFTLRMLRPKDLKWCAAIIDDGFRHKADLLAALPRLWSGLLVADALSMVVIADDVSNQPVAFGAAAIVSDECIKHALLARQPNFAVSVLSPELERPGSSDLPILRPNRVRNLNHPNHGVNLAVLHYSEVLPNRTLEEIHLVRDKALKALLEMQRGYALKEFLMEFYGSEDLPFVTMMGLKLRNDFEEFFSTQVANCLPVEPRPYLFGLRREEVVERWGSPAAMLFSYSAPVCFFSTGQQRVLLRAGRNEKDADIAYELGVEPSTLREHWRAIFARVAKVQKSGLLRADYLPDFSITKNRSRNTLNLYLKEHPEELRPVNSRHFAQRSSSA